ncbi:MAG: Ig-like domain-containing protein [Methyloligellaceae bacterium]
MDNILTGNQAPTATAGSATGAEDAVVSVNLAGTDLDTGDSVEQFRVDSLPDHGTLLLNGNPVSAGDTVTPDQISNGDLTFQPDANWNGRTQLSFSAHDGDAWS